MNKVALITGASSGIGLLTSVTLAKRGWRVLATMRDLGRKTLLEDATRSAGVLERIEIHALDVTKANQIAALADLIGKRPAPLHAIVNNAGFALPGFADDVTDAELRQQFDTNFFGAAAATGIRTHLDGVVDLGTSGLPGRGELCRIQVRARGMD